MLEFAVFFPIVELFGYVDIRRQAAAVDSNGLIMILFYIRY
jgi:hypothetical protein